MSGITQMNKTLEDTQIPDHAMGFTMRLN